MTNKHNGFILVIILLILFAITLLGFSAMEKNLLEAKMIQQFNYKEMVLTQAEQELAVARAGLLGQHVNHVESKIKSQYIIKKIKTSPNKILFLITATAVYQQASIVLEELVELQGDKVRRLWWHQK